MASSTRFTDIHTKKRSTPSLCVLRVERICLRIVHGERLPDSQQHVHHERDEQNHQPELLRARHRGDSL
jgi:hypothetical protein